MNDTRIIKLTKELVKLICEVNTKYQKYVTIENGKEVLFMKLLNDFDGCMQ